MWKTWHTYVVRVSIGLLMILIILIITSPSTKTSTPSHPPLALKLSTYGLSDVYYGKPSENSQVQNLLNNYKGLLKKQGSKGIITDSVSNGLIKYGKEHFVEYLRRAVVAAEFEEGSPMPTANAMYSNTALHGAVISLNLVNNAIAKTFLGPSISIETKNAPLPHLEIVRGETVIAMAWQSAFLLGLLFIVGAFVIIPLEERVSCLKQLIYMTGVNSWTYWLQKILCDLLVYLCVVVVLITLIIVTQNRVCVEINFLVTLLVVLVVFGIVAIPFTYLFSFANTVTSADNLMVFVGIIGVYIGMIIWFVFELLQWKDTSLAVRILLTINPYFWFGYNFYHMAYKAKDYYNFYSLDADAKITKCKLMQMACCNEKSQECLNFKSYWQRDLWPPYILLYLLVATLFHFTLLIFMDSLIFKKTKEANCIWNKRRRYTDVESLEPDTIYLVSHLKKKYGRKIVVKDVNFNVRKGMCFGLLGVNGAGKSTTFKMLTGDTIPHSGNASIFNEFLMETTLGHNRRAYLKCIGYCPQNNALNTVLSCGEHLKFFAILRGMKRDVIPQDVINMITVLGLQPHVNVKCGKYSGGNKRKLCLAIALIGNPKILFLDEPTTGVDPGARRQFWAIIKQIKDAKKQGVVLTSHSMDECEELCDRLAIMKEGLVLCQDNVPNLKATYGKGYTVIIKIKKESSQEEGEQSSLDKIEEAFLTHFKNEEPVLKNKHSIILHFYVPDKIKLSSLFDKMEAFQKNNVLVEDYTIAMASLEDIFLSFAEADQ